MNTYNIARSTELILFQLFAISFPILCQTQRLYQTKEFFLKQGKPFILQCQKNNGSKYRPHLDLQILGYNGVFCLSGCEFQNRLSACIALANLTSNFYCGNGKYCDWHDQCNFVFNNAIIGLDDYQLACTDDGVPVNVWQLKGIETSFRFHLLPINYLFVI